MKLSDYIKAQRGNATVLAAKLDISLSRLSQIAHNSESTSPATCVGIEKATAGAVTRQELRADWMEIWPELAHPCHCPKGKATRSGDPKAKAGA